MKIVCISDTHNQHDKIEIPECDLLIHAGDFTGGGSVEEVRDFVDWFVSLEQAREKVVIAGNHDTSLDVNHKEYDSRARILMMRPEFYYLNDSGVYLHGMSIYGSPYVPTIPPWAFGGISAGRLPENNEPHLREVYEKIPKDTEILVTHSPPATIRDGGYGSPELMNRLLQLRVSLHVFGHVHHAYGVTYMADPREPIYVNACSCDYMYDPTNPPICIQL